MSQSGLIAITNSILPPDVPLTFVADTGSATAASHILNVLGGSGATTNAFGNTIEVIVSSSGFTWHIVTSADIPVQIVVENGYICSGASQVEFVLPLTASNGDAFEIFSFSSKFNITPNGSQKMVVGAVTGALGATGTCTSNSPGDNITFYYMGSNTFQSKPPQGTFTVVS